MRKCYDCSFVGRLLNKKKNSQTIFPHFHKRNVNNGFLTAICLSWLRCLLRLAINKKPKYFSLPDYQFVANLILAFYL